MTPDGLVDGKLALPIECMTSDGSTRMHAAIVEAVMLWPNKPEARRKALHTSTIASILTTPQSATPNFDTLRLAADAMPLSVMRTEAEHPYVSGIVAGFVLCETVGKIKLGIVDASLGDAISKASTTFWPKWRLSEKTINNVVWRNYKPVAHLWAAHWLRRQMDIDLFFPCLYTQISEFLSLSEGFRSLGESLKTHKSRSTILTPGSAIIPPFDVFPVEPEFYRT